MFLLLLTLRAVAVISLPEAEYRIFPGFDPFSWTLSDEEKTTSEEMDIRPSPSVTLNPVYKWVEVKGTNGEQTSPLPLISPSIHVHRSHRHRNVSRIQDLIKKTSAQSRNDTTTTSTTLLGDWSPLKSHLKFTCPEDELPSSIGSYEVPTQRDLVLLTTKTLHRMFTNYHQKTIQFLEDIRKATTAAKAMERKCSGSKPKYRACVKYVSRKCETVTKSITYTLELQRRDIIAFGQRKICSLSDMKQDPVKLIQLLASEEASLEFALPGFLRMLNSCSSFCKGNSAVIVKPPRHLSDTDLVVRHFLTRKKYVRVMPDNNTTVTTTERTTQRTTPRIFKNKGVLLKKKKQ